MNASAVRERLRLFAEVCDAVSYAHRRGVIHRDLKPANILVDSDGRPHVLDFGIAKALEADRGGGDEFDGASRAHGHGTAVSGDVHPTLHGEFAGTPAYASPEQVSGDPGAIDTRTDVYSLGVMLYQLLTGKSPYPTSGGLSVVVRHIRESIPPPPSASTPCVDRDLDAIVSRAMEKDKERRYGSVAALQRDAENYLSGDAVTARSESAWYVLRKSVRRYRVAAASVLAAFALLAGFAGAMAYLYGLKRDAEAAALGLLRVRDIEHGRTEAHSGDAGLALELLWRAHLEPGAGSPPPRTIRFGGAIEPLDSYWALWEFYVRHPCVRAVETPPHDELGGVFLSPDGAWLACHGADGVRVWSLPDMQPWCVLPVHESPYAVVFTPDGGSVVIVTRGGRLEVWSVPEAERVVSFGVLERRVVTADVNVAASAAAFGDGSRVVRLVRWGGNLGEGVMTVGAVEVGGGNVRAVRFNADGSLLAVAAVDASGHTARSIIGVWTVPGCDLIAGVEHAQVVFAPEFLPGDRTLIWSSTSAEIGRWEFASSGEVETALVTPRAIGRTHYREDGGSVVVTDSGRMIRIWDLSGRGEIAAIGGHADQIQHAVSLPGEPIRITTAGHAEVREWEHPFRPWTTLRFGDLFGNHSVAFNPDGKSVAIAGGVGEGSGVIVRWIDGEDRGWEAVGHDWFVTSVAFSGDGRLLASGGADGVVCLWRADDGTLLRRFTEHSAKVAWVAFDPASDRLASAGDDAIVIRALDGGSPLALTDHTDRVPCVEFSPDGRSLASASMDGTVRVWDTTSWRVLSVLTPHGGAGVRVVKFSPDGAWLASGGDDRNVVLTGLLTGERRVLRGHADDVFALAFEPDGRVLVAGDRAGSIMLWEVESKKRIATLPGHRELLMCIAVSPDGMTIATSSAGVSPEVRLWDLGAPQRHVAGSLEYEASRVARSLGREPSNLGAMRRWAAEVGAER